MILILTLDPYFTTANSAQEEMPMELVRVALRHQKKSSLQIASMPKNVFFFTRPVKKPIVSMTTKTTIHGSLPLTSVT